MKHLVIGLSVVAVIGGTWPASASEVPGTEYFLPFCDAEAVAPDWYCQKVSQGRRLLQECDAKEASSTVPFVIGPLDPRRNIVTTNLTPTDMDWGYGTVFGALYGSCNTGGDVYEQDVLLVVPRGDDYYPIAEVIGYADSLATGRIRGSVDLGYNLGTTRSRDNVLLDIEYLHPSGEWTLLHRRKATLNPGERRMFEAYTLRTVETKKEVAIRFRVLAKGFPRSALLFQRGFSLHHMRLFIPRCYEDASNPGTCLGWGHGG